MIIERTKNSIRNAFSGLISKLVAIIFPFIIRTCLLYVLGPEYLGLNSLFASILSVLNLAELGFGSGIVFAMYKPIVDDDTEMICALMNLFKKTYRIIGHIVLGIGIIILPFLSKLVHGDVPQNINIYCLYLIYLSNTVVSYFLFAYKNCLLAAHQRNNISSNINTCINVCMYLLQISLLVVFKNYYLYIILLPVTSALINVANARFARKMFPQYKCSGTIPPDLLRDIKLRVSGLFINRLCQTTRNSLDSVIISAFLGLTAVAIYNNYYYIMSSVIGVLFVISDALSAGVGNSIASESKKKNLRDMQILNFGYMWLAGVCTVCLACLYQHFMRIWAGQALMLSDFQMALFCVYFYILKMGDIRALYYDSAGLWWYGKWRAIVETITNLLLNILMGYLWGITGVILATIISLFLINFIYGSQLTFKYYFGQGSKKYYTMQLLYSIVTAVAVFIAYGLCSFLPQTGINYLLIKLLICFVVSNIVLLLCYQNTTIFKEAKNTFTIQIKRHLKSKHKSKNIMK